MEELRAEILEAERSRSDLLKLTRVSSTPWRDERAENCAGQQELQVCREVPRAVPTAAAVEELVSARTEKWEDVLEVRRGARSRAQRRRIERSAPRGEEDEARQAAADLEPARADVLVREAVARKMEDRAREERREPRPAGGARRGAGGHVECNDHGAVPSRWARAELKAHVVCKRLRTAPFERAYH